MAEFDRKALRAIFEGADLEVPPKDVLGKICDLHTANADGKDETIKDLREKLENAEQERDALKAKGGDDYKAKYEKVKKDFDDYKADVTAKETKAAKEKAVRAYFEGKKITGGNLNIAMRGAKDEINGLELDADGKSKDTAALDALVGGEFAGLVVTTTTKGANTSTPPAGNGNGGKMTKAEIMKITDTAARQKAIAENLSEFGY